MKRSILLLSLLLLSIQSANACSPQELSEKMKAILEVSKVAYEKVPGGNGQRKAESQAIIARYSQPGNGADGAAMLDGQCKMYDELLSLYK
jgi:hypothetical protein